MKVAIIGAGFSGTQLYKRLIKDNHDVTLFEKARGAGGRCSTRYIKDKFVDHGTPFFEASSKEFRKFCDTQTALEVLYEKNHLYYPKNGMNKICSYGLDEDHLKRDTKIISCKYQDHLWILEDHNHQLYDQFDMLFITIPASQVLEIDMQLSLDTIKQLQSVKYDSVATLILYKFGNKSLNSDQLEKSGLFKKIVHISSLYNEPDFSSYVLHLDEKLTNKQNFKTKDQIKSFICDEVYKATKIDLEDDFVVVPHFWKYAFVTKNLQTDFLYLEDSCLGFCGDYFGTKDLEGSYLSVKRLYEERLQNAMKVTN